MDASSPQWPLWQFLAARFGNHPTALSSDLSAPSDANHVYISASMVVLTVWSLGKGLGYDGDNVSREAAALVDVVEELQRLCDRLDPQLRQVRNNELLPFRERAFPSGPGAALALGRLCLDALRLALPSGRRVEDLSLCDIQEVRRRAGFASEGPVWPTLLPPAWEEVAYLLLAITGDAHRLQVLHEAAASATVEGDIPAVPERPKHAAAHQEGKAAPCPVQFRPDEYDNVIVPGFDPTHVAGDALLALEELIAVYPGKLTSRELDDRITRRLGIEVKGMSSHLRRLQRNNPALKHVIKSSQQGRPGRPAGRGSTAHLWLEPWHGSTT